MRPSIVHLWWTIHGAYLHCAPDRPCRLPDVQPTFFSATLVQLFFLCYYYSDLYINTPIQLLRRERSLCVNVHTTVVFDVDALSCNTNWWHKLWNTSAAAGDVDIRRPHIEYQNTATNRFHPTRLWMQWCILDGPTTCVVRVVQRRGWSDGHLQTA